ncbi:MAG: glycosyltransferase [Pseudomonadota bacterium]
MRISHIVSSLGIGGAEAFVTDLGIAQARAGLAVQVIALSDAAELGETSPVGAQNLARLEAAGVEVATLGHRARRRILPAAWAMRGRLNTFRPDIVHAHLPTGILLLILSGWRGAMVATHHNTPLPLPAWAMGLLARRARGFVAISQPGVAVLEGVCRCPVTLIPNGIDLSRIPDAPPPSRAEGGPLTVLSLGNLRAQKNYPHLVEIAARLPGFRFQIAGEGDERGAIEAAIARHGVADRVTLLGARSDVPDLLVGADIFLQTSTYEGMPIALIEAMRAGLPIVASDVGACGEMLEGSGALLAPPNDTDAFVAHLSELAESAPRRTEIAEKARQRARIFDIEITAARYHALYETVIP